MHPSFTAVLSIVLLGSTTSVQAQRVIHQENFDNGNGSFPALSEQAASTVYLSEGVFAMSVYEAKFSYAVTSGAVPATDNASISVKARQSTPQFDSVYGLTCRVQKNGSRYMLAVSAIDQSWFAARIEVRENTHHLTTLGKGTLPAARFRDIDQLRADCVGQRMTLFLNGEPVAEISDGALPVSGSVGLSISSAEELNGIATVLFDDFIVTTTTPANASANAPATAGSNTGANDLDFIDSPPVVANPDNASVTGTWTGSLINEGELAEDAWLNLQQEDNGATGTLYVRLIGKPGYLEIGQYKGIADSTGKLSGLVTVEPHLINRGPFGETIEIALDFYARPGGNKAIGIINLKPGGTGTDANAIGSIKLTQQ